MVHVKPIVRNDDVGAVVYDNPPPIHDTSSSASSKFRQHSASWPYPDQVSRHASKTDLNPSFGMHGSSPVEGVSFKPSFDLTVFTTVGSVSLAPTEDRDALKTRELLPRISSTAADKVVDTSSRKNTLEDKNLHPDNPDPEDSMTVTVIAAGAIGSVLLIVVVGVLIKFAMKRSHPRQAWRRRHPPSVLRRHPYLHKHPSLT
ncbi:hypothetical protein LSH36_133g01011 [Paralvinella palmiformis]|uniref:Uncharacterized protein n=1 Tax=Paralvinella palmiformis TaxID=53620 RepID=A0AAD9JX05_9ANNE|nr:hypothetical protein LSH36_133g01011 [Paralvinella palmiformis]